MECFSPHFYHRKIALMKLDYPVQLGGRIQLAKLPKDCRILDKGEELVIFAGTGSNSVEPLRYTIDLEYGISQTSSWAECDTILGNLNHPRHICAKIRNGQSMFYGDSGMDEILQISYILCLGKCG